MKLAAPRSLLGQFVALHILVAAVGAIVLLWSASALLHHTADRFQRDLLSRQAAASAAPAGDGGARPAVLPSGMAVARIGADGRTVRTAGPPRPAVVAAAPLDRTPRFFRHGAVEGYSVPAHGGWIVVSQDDADPAVVADDIVRIFLRRFILIGLPIVALLPLIGAVLAGRLTLRMRAVSTIAATIGPRSLETRLPLGVLPLEAEPLAVATNAALDRLAAAIHVQAAFAADVAHELRTPLAVIRLRADAIEDPVIRGVMLLAVDRAARVVSQLLALAELERPIEDGGTPVNLHALAEAVVADRAPGILAGGRTIAFEQEDQAAAVRAYPDALRLALENLVDNAARHTAAGTAIVVRSGPGCLSVSDDGAAIPESHLARLKERLWRGATTKIGGSGIGLSIVERVARAHGGSLIVRRGTGGRGLIFVIALNDAPDDARSPHATG